MSRAASRYTGAINMAEKKSICEIRLEYKLTCEGCLYHNVCDERRDGVARVHKRRNRNVTK